MTEQNMTDQKIYNKSGEHIGYIDIFTDIDGFGLSIFDPDDTTKLIIYLMPSKK